jgi:trans-2,3-dihydro-3-hydroxyanthranilate isomerase
VPRLLFYHLDVFTSQPLEGNPLAVFTETAGITAEQMQSLARELNLSETIFITQREPERLRFHARIFTPLREMAFTGHPVLGAAWLLLRDVHPAATQLTLALQVGDVQLTVDRSIEPHLVYFTPPPVNLETALTDFEFLARLYGVRPEDFAYDAAPAQLASVGPRFLIAPLRHRGALERCRIDLDALAYLAASYDCDLPVAFCREGYAGGSQFALRVFAPRHGITEDPATGAAASCLAAYLRHHRLIQDCGDKWLKLDQGYSIRRPSLLWLRANLDRASQRIDVQIGGQVAPLAWGAVEL